VFAVGGQNFNTSKSVSSPTGVWDGASFGGMTLDGGGTPGEVIDENNLWAHHYFSSGISSRYAYNQSSATEATSNYAADLVGMWGGGDFGIIHYTEGLATSASSKALTVPSTTAGNLTVVTVSDFNSTARTVSSVCFDGTTCAAGNAFTQYTAATTTGNTSHANTDIWYILSAPSGKTTATVTLNGSASKINVSYWELQKGTGNWATSGGNKVTAGTITAGHLDNGPTVSSLTGSNFCAAAVGTDGGVDINPNTGNAYVYGGILYNQSDAAVSTITSAASAQPVWHDTNTSGTFNASNGCFK
jgi:hypothetical protein